MCPKTTCSTSPCVIVNLKQLYLLLILCPLLYITLNYNPLTPIHSPYLPITVAWEGDRSGVWRTLPRIHHRHHKCFCGEYPQGEHTNEIVADH